MTYDATLAMNSDALTEAVDIARRSATLGATLTINDARKLRDLVEMMARVIRTEPERHPTTTPQSEATLDDAARYLRAQAHSALHRGCAARAFFVRCSKCCIRRRRLRPYRITAEWMGKDKEILRRQMPFAILLPQIVLFTI